MMSRLVGSVGRRSWLKLVATCAVCVRTSARAADDGARVSVIDAGPSVTSSGSICVGASVTVRSWRSKPLSSKVILYVPGGSSGMM